ncbi:MAG: hypothetical protein GY757_32540, partial [bacterium]|nr:hypothetical protein [bacterium]
MTLFVIKFFLTNIVFSLIIALVLMRYNPAVTGPDQPGAGAKKGKHYSKGELLLYSLGLGPVFTILLLYYLLIFLKGYSNMFYLVSVLLVYLLLFILARPAGIPAILKEIKQTIQAKFRNYRQLSLTRKIPPTLYWIFLIILFTALIYLYLGNSIHTPIEGHDTLIYGNIGKIYYAKKSVSYSAKITDTEKGFVFSSSPKPSFSLILTWEMILNATIGGKEEEGPHDYTFDMYFRSISAYYALLIVCVQFYWLYKKNRYLALLGIVVLLSGLRFYLMFVNYHLDSYRIFFFILSWIFLVYTMQKKEGYSLFLFGVFTGLAAFTHLIGLVAAVLNVLAYLLFYPMEADTKTGTIKKKLVMLIPLVAIILIFGGIHYLADALFGA